MLEKLKLWTHIVHGLVFHGMIKVKLSKSKTVDTYEHGWLVALVQVVLEVEYDWSNNLNIIVYRSYMPYHFFLT